MKKDRKQGKNRSRSFLTKIKDGRLFFGAVEVLVFEACCCALLLHAHGQVDKREDVVLNHDGEAEKDGVQGEDVHPQFEIQLPLVQMDPQHLHTRKQSKRVGRNLVQ